MQRSPQSLSLLQRLARPFRRSRRDSLTRIQRRARDLMSLASAASVVVVTWWFVVGVNWHLAITSSGQASSGTTHDTLIRWHAAIPSQHANGWVLFAVWLAGLLVALTPLIALRRLGSALYRESPLSRPVARRFRTLAHALTFNLVGGCVVSLVAASEFATWNFNFSIGFWGTLVAAMLAYTVAQIIGEGALAAEENRAFV